MLYPNEVLEEAQLAGNATTINGGTKSATSLTTNQTSDDKINIGKDVSGTDVILSNKVSMNLVINFLGLGCLVK